MLEKLIAAAWETRKNAYAPYSHFAVGAAVLTTDGHIYTGCNIENVSYGLTNCAERTAIFQAVAHGEREFTHLAICTDTATWTAPCGACRQVMLEFAPQMQVIMVNNRGERKQLSAAELMPDAFADFQIKTEEGRGDRI